MATLEELRARIRTIDDLHGVVRTMKALAQVGSRRYQAVRASLEDYAANVDLALQALMQERRFRAWSHPLPGSVGPPAGEEVGMILFGTDHGLCGTFNERVLDCARGLCEERAIPAEHSHVAVVGGRLEALLVAEGWQVEECFRVPTSLEGAARLVQDLLLLVERWHFPAAADGAASGGLEVSGASPALGTVLLLLQGSGSPASCVPMAWTLLPIDPAWLRRVGGRRWHSRSQPLLLQPEPTLFAAILREQVHVLLFRAVVESLASENGARLRAMHSAEQHIEERLGDLHATFRRQRQDAITAELLDIVAGFEALDQEG